MNNQEKNTALESILWAKSVAVIGASANPDKLGHIILKNIIKGGFQGRIYPVNPGGGDILEHKVYPDIEDLPGNVDLFIFCIPAKFIIPLLNKASEKGASGAIIISGGFREVGNQALETALVEEARKTKIALIGPNCQGINFAPNQLCASWPLITRAGSHAVISQSGTIAASMAGWFEEDSLGISGAISLGNQADLCETDFLEALSKDPQTKVIAMYIEGVRDGRRFMRVAQEVEQPIVVLKSGRTPGGAKAAASHTKSLAGSDQVFSGICDQCGIIRVDTTQELYDVSSGIASYPLPRGNRLAIITSSGGSGILAVDSGENRGLSFPAIPKNIQKALRESTIPNHAVIGNPLDLTGSALSGDYLEALDVIDQFDLFDMYLLIFGDPIPDSAKAVIPTIKEMNKPVGICYIGGGDQQKKESLFFQEQSIPVYPTPERAISFLSRLNQRGEYIRFHIGVH